MTITREDLASGRVDFSDVSTGEMLPVVHPGDVLREEFLKPIQLSVYELKKALKVPRSRLNDIVLGRRAVSIDTALRLGRYFGISAQYWLNLQFSHDLDLAERGLSSEIACEVKPRAAKRDIFDSVH